MEGGSAQMCVADRPRKPAGPSAPWAVTMVAPVARSPSARQNDFTSMAFADASLRVPSVITSPRRIAMRDATRADGIDKGGIGRGGRNAPPAMLGAVSVTGQGRRGPGDIGFGQELQYALHDRSDGFRGECIAGQLVTRRLRQINDQLRRSLDLIEPRLDGRGVDDRVLVGVDDEDWHLERAEMNGTRMVEQVHERDNRLRRVVSGPEFGVAATVGMEAIFFADEETCQHAAERSGDESRPPVSDREIRRQQHHGRISGELSSIATIVTSSAPVEVPIRITRS